jgi:hypothetical protein
VSSSDEPTIVGPGWIDNIKLTTLNNALTINGDQSATIQGTDAQRYWASPMRTHDTDLSDALEFTLPNVTLVNHIKLDLVKYPHDARVEYFDEDARIWTAMLDATQNGEHPVGKSILECVPAIIPPDSLFDVGQNPQHSFPNHWDRNEWRCHPIRCQRIRVVCTRHNRTPPPCDNRGNPVPYSLGCRNLYCGYKVDSFDSVPRPQAVVTSYTESDSFATSTDLLGSSVSYSIRINRAGNILLNSENPLTGAVNVDSTLVWKCEPQPYPWCVVNYYMDVRDASSAAQIIDRFYIDPLYNGPNLNLYYSNDEPTGVFTASDDPIPPSLSVINGQFSGTPLSNSNPVGQVCYVDIQNTACSFVPGRRWWIGSHHKWKFHRRSDSNEHPFFDCDEFHLAWTQYGMRWASRHGDYFYLDCDDFDPTDEFKFMCWHDGAGTISLRLYCRDRVFSRDFFCSVELRNEFVNTLRWGGFLGAGHGDDDRFGDTNQCSGDFYLLDMVFKQDEDCDDDKFADYCHNSQPYAIMPEFAHQDTGQTNNALLRYFPDFATNGFSTGFKGGAADRYASLNWAPIARDYTLVKGFLQFNPTKAKYWKLEFCSLVAEPYEVYIPIKKTVQTYTVDMWAARALTVSTLENNLSNLLPGVGPSASTLATTNQYADSANVSVGSGANVTGTGQSNTMARVVTDPKASDVLTAVNWAWAFVPTHGCGRNVNAIPVFEQISVHTYQEIAVEQSTKIAYFAGLKFVQPYRVDYLSVDDTPEYYEMFHDSSHIDADNGWILEADHSLSSGRSSFAQVQSMVMPSSRIVRAVQFATTQSAPFQLLPDSDFDDPTHAHWNSVGDGSLASSTQVVTAVGSTLQVNRSSRVETWAALEASYSTWQAIQNAVAIFSGLEGAGNPAQGFGGIESNGAATPPGGRIYAAARVVAPAALSSPLYVQIVDALTEQILSEESVVVPANQVTEWYTAYTVGEGGTIQAWRWNDFYDNFAYPSFSDSFIRVNATSLGTLTSGQLWNSGTVGHAIVSVEAVTTVAGAYDYIDGGTPWGTLQITVGTMAGTGQTYAQLLDFSPFYLDDQGILSYTGGALPSLPATSVFGRAVQANDVLRVDVLPTKLVTSGLRDTSYPDNVSAPYSLVFYLNGSWVKTVAHRHGARTKKGIRGRLNQQFSAFSWSPQVYGQLPGPVLHLLPVPANGSFSADLKTWTDSNSSWAVRGSWDNTSVSGVLVATGNGSSFVTDTQYWYGTLMAYVRHVATGATGFSTPHGNVLALDATAGIYLNAAGNVVDSSGTSYGTLIPGGIANNSLVSIQFLDTKSVDVSIRGAINPTTYPRMLVARVGGAVVGTLANAQLQTVWTGTVRGLCGDAYNTNGGSLPGGSIADLHTSFINFSWAPDASNVVVVPTSPTWDEISQRGTGTYDSISHDLTLHQGNLKARVVQKTPSVDVWNMDTLSMFADPIVWSFSNDGGYTFWNAYDIKNDPTGVMVFPDSEVVPQSISGSTVPISPGQALIWRAISYAPNSKISSVVIRPWYGGLLSGITHRVGIVNGGPNVMPYDQYSPIEQDPSFQTWHGPIPQDWFYRYRILAQTNNVTQVTAVDTISIPEELMSTYEAGEN